MQKRTIDGKLYFFCPLGRRAKDINKAGKKSYRPLSDEVPWLSVSALGKIVNDLAGKGYILVVRRTKGNIINSAWYDRTLNYHVPEKVCKKCVGLKKECKAVRWFNPDEACRFTLNCALVLNIVYREFRLTAKEEQHPLRFIPSDISRDLGIRRTTVIGIFNNLVEAKYLTSYELSEGKAYTLNVPNPCKMKGYGKGRKKLAKAIDVVRVETNCNPMNPYQHFNMTVTNFINAEVLRIFVQAYFVFMYLMDVALYEYDDEGEVRLERKGEVSKKRTKKPIAKLKKRTKAVPFTTQLRRENNKALKAAGKTERYRSPAFELAHNALVGVGRNPVALLA